MTLRAVPYHTKLDSSRQRIGATPSIAIYMNYNTLQYKNLYSYNKDYINYSRISFSLVCGLSISLIEIVIKTMLALTSVFILMCVVSGMWL